MHLRILAVVAAFALGLASCSKEIEYTDLQKECIANRYKAYDAKNIIHCIDVCKGCMYGNFVTCNTSCRLRGAS